MPATSPAPPPPAADAPLSTSPTKTAPSSSEVEQVVTPWEVKAEKGVDYERLIRDFGCQPISEELLERFVRVTGCKEPHHFLRRGVFFSHRDLDGMLDAYEAGKPVFLYTGRGPSSEAMHLGHLVPFQFTAWLQKVLGAVLVVQMTDDEKFLFKDGLSLREANRLAHANAKDILACGFDQDRTFIFSNLEYMSTPFYRMILEIQNKVSFSKVRSTFGFSPSDSIGRIAFPATQAAPSFAATFPHIFGDDEEACRKIFCLIPCAIDQDPYFRVTREVAPQLGLLKPSLIHSRFFPALQGFQTKMSASAANTAIYLTDSPKEIRKKIMKHAYSGGCTDIDQHRAQGANLDVDVSYHYLTFFLEDDKRLAEIADAYSSGRMLTGEIKEILIETLVELVQGHQTRRAQVTDELVNEFMRVRPLNTSRPGSEPTAVPASQLVGADAPAETKADSAGAAAAKRVDMV